MGPDMTATVLSAAGPLRVGSTVASIPSPPFRDLALGPLSFRMYGLMIALGVIAAVWIARRRYSSYGGDPEDITTIALVAVPAGLVGARLYHVITDWPDLYSDGRWWPKAFMIWQGGLGIPGGVLLGAIAGVVACRVMGISWRIVGDAVAPAIPVAQAIGRLGNWFNQEVFGRPTSLPWGLRIDPQYRPPGDEAFATFHPTFLYEGLWNLGLMTLLILVDRKRVLRPGSIFWLYVAGYATGRLWVEAMRIDPASLILGVRVNIWTSLIALAVALTIVVVRGKRRPEDDEALTSEPHLRASGDGPPDGEGGDEVGGDDHAAVPDDVDTMPDPASPD